MSGRTPRGHESELGRQVGTASTTVSQVTAREYDLGYFGVVVASARSEPERDIHRSIARTGYDTFTTGSCISASMVVVADMPLADKVFSKWHEAGER